VTSELLQEAVDLVRAARALYQADAQASALLVDLENRLQEPLRVAIAGIVKAGKSTLLNALLGEQIAPTDAGECTRVVTWYRYGDTPSITLRLHDAPPRRMPIRRLDGKLVLDLGGLAPTDVERIDISWPISALKDVLLIDTPGIASLSQDISEKSGTFLTPDDAPSSADAIIYLMRHLHPSDLKFLEAFRDTAAGPSRTVNAVAVLSRADEIGSGRIDSLLSAAKVARRYERDGELSSLALGVIPVAGLLAEGARTLRQQEFAAFAELASLERGERERLLVSADRFVRPSEVVSLSEDTRRQLLDRFGMFGVRLGTALIRTGATDSAELSSRLVQQSGLLDLSRFIRLQFGSRAAPLKVRGVLEGLGKLLRDKPREGVAPILGGIERIQASAHSLRELSLLSQARVSGLPFQAAETEEIVRIIGGDGTTPAARLGLPDDANEVAIKSAWQSELTRWRTKSQSPLTERPAVAVCRVVIRSLEQIGLEIGGGAGAADRPAPDIVLLDAPVDGVGETTDQQREQHEPALGG